MNQEHLPSLFAELQKMCDPFWTDTSSLLTRNEVTGLSMYEDDDHIYLEAAVPGVKPDQIQISVEKGIIWIKAEAPMVEESKNRKVYFKTERSYSYRVPLPMRIDEQTTPDAAIQDGILKITMAKSRTCKPMKIAVKSS